MKQNFMKMSAVAIIVLCALLSIIAIAIPVDSSSHIDDSVVETTQPTVIEETTQPTVMETIAPTFIPEVTTEATEPTVNNPVNDVNNSVEPTEPSYTQEELEILAIIIYQEAGGNAYSDDTRLKVGSVFLNRVKSPSFPNTFEEVATARRQYGTLHWTGIKWPIEASYATEANAVDRAYRIAEELLIGGSILPDNVVWQAEFVQGDGIYSHQDGIYFCYTEVKE